MKDGFSTDELHNKTRDIYSKQHKRVANDKTTFKRFLDMIQEEYFNLPKDYFKGKRVVDVGCGNYGKFLIRFHDFGCIDLTGVELGEDFKKGLRPILDDHSIPVEHYNLVNGSVLDLPFADESFDFVCCHGVLPHLANKQEFYRGFKELSRMTKKGGFLYVVTGVYGGLVEAIIPTVREYYRSNDEFKNLVDNISPGDFDKVFDFIEEKIFIYEDEQIRIRKYFRELFDVDLCVTIQNVLQVPIRIILSPNEMLELFHFNGFDDVKQLKRYVKRSNIRRFLAPLHYHRDELISRILYGQGNLEFLGMKEDKEK